MDLLVLCFTNFWNKVKNYNLKKNDIWWKSGEMLWKNTDAILSIHNIWVWLNYFSFKMQQIVHYNIIRSHQKAWFVSKESHASWDVTPHMIYRRKKRERDQNIYCQFHWPYQTFTSNSAIIISVDWLSMQKLRIVSAIRSGIVNVQFLMLSMFIASMDQRRYKWIYI